MNPYFFVGALAIGVMAAIVGTAIAVFARPRNNVHYERTNVKTSREPSNAKNLICPYCGAEVTSNEYTFNCGHTSHNSCYRREPPENRLCRLCRDADPIPEVVSPIANDNLRRRSTAASNATTTQESKNDNRSAGDVASRIQNEFSRNVRSQEPPASATDEPMQCCMCGMDDGDFVRLPCLHFMHSTCYNSFSEISKCSVCGQSLKKAI